MIEKRVNKRKKWFNKLKIKHRLVIMNDQTYAETFSARLTPLTLFVAAVAGAFLLIFLTTYFIAFTSLKEYIPGYSNDINIKRALLNTNNKLDSLYTALQLKDNFISNIKNIASNNIEKNTNMGKDSTKVYTNIKLTGNQDDSLLRNDLENQDQLSLKLQEEDAVNDELKGYLFYPPITGIVSDKFKSTPIHLGIDIVANKNDAIKATLRGTVILATWTLETGYVMQIQHANDIISIYKHNATLLKKAGEQVMAGDVIAIVGNSGENTNGPHLHFELWRKGQALNPMDFIRF